MSQNAPDAVIIGAGHNSLACAVCLSEAGWRVHVVEQNAEPGGAVKTGEYTAPGFRHDWAAMNLSLFAGSAFFQQHGEKLTGDGAAFVAAKHCFSSVFPDGSWFGVSNDAEENLRRVATFSEKDAAAWKSMSEAFPAEAEVLFAILGSSFGKRASAKTLWSVWRKKGVSGSLDLARFLLSSPREWLDETFETEQIKATLAAWGMHLDFAPDIAGGALFPYLEANANQAFGMALGQGGADTIIKAMVKRIEASGGTIECGAAATRILVEGGKAVGIELADGRDIRASKAVIANVAPSALMQLTGRTGNSRYDERMAGFQHAPGTMMIHLAMEALPDWVVPELRDFAYVHLAPSLDQMARTYQQAKAGLLPDTPIIVTGQPTVIDPSRAPEGKHVLWLQVRMVPGVIKGDAAGKIAATDWADAAEPYAERALDIVEQYAPGTRDKIIARRVVTPVELEADNPNLVGGDQVCGSHHLFQNFLFRPMRGYTDGRTPIDRLFHTGASVWPGAGTGAGSGTMLGQKLTR